MGTGFHFEEDMTLFTLNGQDIPIILVLMAAATAVEVLLALKKDGRPGLVLPGLVLLWSAAQLVVRMIQVSRYSTLSARGGELCMAFAVENLPTLILLAVYGLCRLGKGWRVRRQLDKTRIEDL